ncbi:MAG: tetratricopeptide repeat protein [Bacteroidetes bacterium]|nr:tetratricopeptide repeat protein [Bacteroidota bacterium]
MAKRLGNIGIVYDFQGDYPKALDYYFKSLKMFEDLGNKNGIAADLGNIGNIYDKEAGSQKTEIKRDSLFNKALTYYFRSLKIAEELGNKNGIAIWLSNIGIVYDKKAGCQKSDVRRDSLNKKALDYYFKALKMDEELGRKSGIATNLGNIGSLYSSAGKFKDAEEYLQKALALSIEIGSKEGVMEWEQNISELYSKLRTPRYKLALEHYKLYIVYRDSIANEENTKKQTRIEMQYEFDKKEAATKAEADKQAAVAEAESRRQKIILYFVLCTLFIVLVFAVFIFRALRITQKQKQLIELQKKVVEEKQNEILASIRYAKRIQDALLPTEKYIDKTLKRLMKNN